MNTPHKTFMSLPRRLDKFLKDTLGWTRSEVHTRLGDVRVNESPGIPFQMVFAEDEVRVKDEVVSHKMAPRRTFVFHKPAGIITAHSDPHGRPCLDRFSGDWGKACAIGRLDKDTTGLLLLSDDGDLSFALIHPRFHVQKTYELTVSPEILPEDPRLLALQREIDIGIGVVCAREVKWRQPGLIEMTLDEGKNRQIRRMCGAVRIELLALHRRLFGPVELDVEEGETRELGADEVSALWESVGGRKAIALQQFEALSQRAKTWRERGLPDVKLEAWLDDNRIF